ncbi:MAG: helix-turn-helix domain-containing protein [Deltaproteobacteria bacterium]|nr:helix-turn-helix domain-containing protein [Deltaproteobacteria bacterium]
MSCQWPAWMKPSTGAAYCDCGLRTFRKLLRSGEIPVARLPNGRMLVRRRDLDQWLASLQDQQATEVAEKLAEEMK